MPANCLRCPRTRTVSLVNEQTGEQIALCRPCIVTILSECPIRSRRAIRAAILQES